MMHRSNDESMIERPAGLKERKEVGMAITYVDDSAETQVELADALGGLFPALGRGPTLASLFACLGGVGSLRLGDVLIQNAKDPPSRAAVGFDGQG
jgi:hypothetical protein